MMKRIENQDFSNQNHVGVSWRFYTFVNCDFSNSKIIDSDLTGVTFHDCNLLGCAVVNTKATATRWVKGKDAKLSTDDRRDTYVDFDEKLTPEELAYARANDLLMPGSEILEGQDHDREYYIIGDPMRTRFAFRWMPEDCLKNKPAGYIEKRVRFTFLRGLYERYGVPVKKGWSTEDYQFGVDLAWLFRGRIDHALQNMAKMYFPGLKYKVDDFGSTDDNGDCSHPLTAKLMRIFLGCGAESFRAWLQTPEGPEKDAARAKFEADTDAVVADAAPLIKAHFELRKKEYGAGLYGKFEVDSSFLRGHAWA